MFLNDLAIILPKCYIITVTNIVYFKYKQAGTVHFTYLDVTMKYSFNLGTF